MKKESRSKKEFQEEKPNPEKQWEFISRYGMDIEIMATNNMYKSGYVKVFVTKDYQLLSIEFIECKIRNKEWRLIDNENLGSEGRPIYYKILWTDGHIVWQHKQIISIAHLN